MRALRTILIAVIVLGVAGIVGAAGPMTLTRGGDLHAVGNRDNQVVVTTRHADGTLSDLFVPQSAAAVPSSLQVGVDEATGALYVVWQKKTGLDFLNSRTETSIVPSGEKAMDRYPDGSRQNMPNARPESTSHNLAVLSALPVRAFVPSGEKATARSP